MKQPTLAKPLAISEVYDAYLKLFAQLYFLKAEQLTRWFYKPGMLTTVQARLKLLTDAGYLSAFRIPTVKSKSPNMYALAAKGIKYLRDEGLVVDVYYKPSELAELSHSFLWHILELNDFLIAAKCLERVAPQVNFSAFQHDLSLRRNPLRIPVSLISDNNKSTKLFEIVPDSFLDFRVTPGEGRKQRQYCVWVELDRGTEQTIDRFKEKIKRMCVAVSSGKAQEYFHIKRFAAIAFATTAGERRVEQMRRWTQEVLTDFAATSELRDLFIFISFTPTTHPKQLFLDPSWQTPYDNIPLIALLE